MLEFIWKKASIIFFLNKKDFFPSKFELKKKEKKKDAQVQNTTISESLYTLLLIGIWQLEKSLALAWFGAISL